MPTAPIVQNTTINIGSNQQSYNYSLIDSGGNLIQGTTTNGMASVSAPPGVYTLNLADPDNNNILYTGSVNTANSTTVFAPIKSSIDTNSIGSSSTPITSGSYGSTVNSQPNLIIPNNISSEEFIAPNSSFGAYFTCEDARLFIGDVFIDEGIFVQYTLQYNQVPIYGYRSTFYDAVAQGKCIVQGQLGLNFVSEGYLYTVLNAYQQLSQLPASGNQATLNSLAYTEQQLLSTQNNSNTANSSVSSQLQLVQQQKQQLISQLGPSSIDTANAYLTGVNAQNTSSPANEKYTNAVYQNVPFNLVIQFSGAQRTVTRRLEGCQLIANDQVIDSSGNTLTDGYSFIARRLR